MEEMKKRKTDAMCISGDLKKKDKINAITVQFSHYLLVPVLKKVNFLFLLLISTRKCLCCVQPLELITAIVVNALISKRVCCSELQKSPRSGSPHSLAENKHLFYF